MQGIMDRKEEQQLIAEVTSSQYKEGFVTDVEQEYAYMSFRSPPGEDSSYPYLCLLIRLSGVFVYMLLLALVSLIKLTVIIPL